MHPTLAALLLKTPVVTDGAWGTQLQSRGLPLGTCPDAWNLEQPAKVEEVARAYVDAGSQVILTNTFGANRFTLARHGLADRVAEINRSGVEISCRAAAGRAKVFASMGPTGKLLMMGDVTEEELADAFCSQARAMAAGGADGIVVETMSDLAEAAIAVKAAAAAGLPVVACMYFEHNKKGRTSMGVTPEQAAEGLAAAGAEVIGANCGQGIEGFVDICRRLKAATDRPIWIKGNAGLPTLVDGQTTYTQKPQEFASFARPLVDAGASFLGGCCGTTPEFIRALKAAVG
jgi:methionine synthase I (cobalamin-dependent)